VKLLLLMLAAEVRLMVPLVVPSTADAKLKEAPVPVAINVTVLALITPLLAKVVALGAVRKKVPLLAFAVDAPIVTVFEALSVIFTLPPEALALIPAAEMVRAPLLPILPLLEVRLT